MRIIGIGVAAFIIWCLVSSWLYNDKLLPVLRNPVTVLTTPESQTRLADSLMQLKASIPKDLLIYFEFNNSKFKPDPQFVSNLAPFKSWLNKYPDSKIVVTGHTDLVGTDYYNMQLGMKRARIVSGYVQSQGINASRILTESMGESKPIAGYITKEERAKNRRAEISLKMQ
jgi:outer membrane protein OmpA-like peptidoglycan-associated protein